MRLDQGLIDVLVPSVEDVNTISEPTLFWWGCGAVGSAHDWQS